VGVYALRRLAHLGKRFPMACRKTDLELIPRRNFKNTSVASVLPRFLSGESRDIRSAQRPLSH